MQPCENRNQSLISLSLTTCMTFDKSGSSAQSEVVSSTVVKRVSLEWSTGIQIIVPPNVSSVTLDKLHINKAPVFSPVGEKKGRREGLD